MARQARRWEYGRKPNGPVKINKSSIFTENLELVDVFQGDNIDIAGNRINTTTDLLAWKDDGFAGQYVDFNGTTDNIDYGFTPAGVNDFTLIQLIRDFAQAGGGFPASSRSSSSAEGIEILTSDTSGGVIRGRSDGSIVDIQTANLIVDDASLWHMVVYTRMSEVHSIVAVDETGKVFSSSATQTAIGTISSSQSLQAGLRGSVFYSGDSGFLAFSEVGYTESEAILLAENAYTELLKPLNPIPYTVTDVLTLTGPATATSGGSTIWTGTALNTVTTASVISTTSSSSRTQTITAQPGDGLTLTINPTDTGEHDLRTIGAGGAAQSGVGYSAVDVAAPAITHYVLEFEADDGVNPAVTSAVDVSAASGLTVVQTMIVTADTTPGISLFGTDLVVVEDNHQMVGPDILNGMNITYNADGTFSTDSDQTETGLFLYYSPSTKNWTILQLTINQSGIVSGGGIVRDLVRDITGGIVRGIVR